MLCNEKRSHCTCAMEGFQNECLGCDDERQIVDSIIETLEKKTEEHRYHQDFMDFLNQVK